MENRALLGVLQRARLGEEGGGDRRDEFALEADELSWEALAATFPLTEARRYVTYALAAYGDMIWWMAAVGEVAKATADVGLVERVKWITRLEVPPTELMERIGNVERAAVPETEGLPPVMFVPVKATV